MSKPLPITLYDSYTKKEFTLEPNKTVKPNTIKMYSCGPTVYNYQSIGNMRAAWLPDTIAKIAKLAGWDIEWVLNITDVGHLVGDGDEGEDKVEKSAKEGGKTVKEIVDHYTNNYINQTKALNLEIPSGKNNPKATEYVEEQMILALSLLRDERAYLLEDGIYFDSEANNDLDLPTLERFKISGNNKYTGRDIKNTTKHPQDFALWKFVSENNLQKWRFADFPEALDILKEMKNTGHSEQSEESLTNLWGTPGWHSECVCMICGVQGEILKEIKSNYFDEFKNKTVIDIHTGGEDHIDIHHKNEILQSEALGFHLSKHWVHNKFVMVDGGKMSKSLGNVYLVTGKKEDTGFDSLEEKGFDPLAYRLMLFEHHYTEQLNFTWKKLKQSQARLFNMRKEAAKLNSPSAKGWQTKSDGVVSQSQNLIETLTDNLNTPKFLEEYQNLLTTTSSACHSELVSESSKIATLKKLEKELLQLDLFPETPQEIRIMADQRKQAKENKDYAESDKLRDQIADQGWQVDDYAWGYGLWKNPTLKKD